MKAHSVRNRARFEAVRSPSLRQDDVGGVVCREVVAELPDPLHQGEAIVIAHVEVVQKAQCAQRSSIDPFNSKDPTGFPPEHRDIMIRFLRVRHRLVPYLYTAAWRAHSDGVGVVHPMYHDHATMPAAYQVPNQYLLGGDLIVAPITTPRDAASGLSRTIVWLPDGVWFDLFAGDRYRGGRSLPMHRPLATIPVLARAGSTIPLLHDPMQDIGENPDALVLRIMPGSGHSVIYEDDERCAAREALIELVVDMRRRAASLLAALRDDAADPDAVTSHALDARLLHTLSVGATILSITEGERSDEATTEHMVVRLLELLVPAGDGS